MLERQNRRILHEYRRPHGSRGGGRDTRSGDRRNPRRGMPGWLPRGLGSEISTRLDAENNAAALACKRYKLSGRLLPRTMRETRVPRTIGRHSFIFKFSSDRELSVCRSVGFWPSRSRSRVLPAGVRRPIWSTASHSWECSHTCFWCGLRGTSKNVCKISCFWISHRG